MQKKDYEYDWALQGFFGLPDPFTHLHGPYCLSLRLCRK